MKIHFTKKEYRLLVELLYIADWVMDSNQVESDPENPFNVLIQKIFSLYKEMQAEDILERVTELSGVHPTGTLEDKAQEQYIERYDYETMWQILINDLAKRDAINELGEDKFNNLSVIDRIHTLSEYEKKYANEFEANGIKNLKVVYDKTEVN